MLTRLRVSEAVGWRGRVRVTVFRDGHPIWSIKFDNMITNVGRNLLRAALASPVDATLRYVALGADDTPPDAADTTLGDERFRRIVTKQDFGGTGVVRTTHWIAPGQANDFTIEEIGWFAGQLATETPDSGVMIARVSHSWAKNPNESLLIEREDLIGGS